MSISFFRSLLVALIPASACTLWGAELGPKADDSLEHFRLLAETQSFSLGSPRSVAATPDGRTVLFLRSGPRDRALALHELDLASGAERLLLSPEDVLGSGTEVLSAAEKARRERARVRVRGFTRFALADDGASVLLSLSGKLYLYNRRDLSVSTLSGSDWLAPELSPDGRWVAAVKDDDLHVIATSGSDLRALTSGASDTLSRGTAEFVAQEEMDRHEGLWWSPDSRRIAYQETDTSGVERRTLADPLFPERPAVVVPYPRAGTANARVRLGVVGVEGGPTVWVSWDGEAFPYLARVAWEDENHLLVLVQNRTQTIQRLLRAAVATGDTDIVFEERDEVWLNLDGVSDTPLVLKQGGFLWTSETTGEWRVEWRSREGVLLRRLTPPGFVLRGIIGADEEAGRLLVLGHEGSLEAQVWSFPLGGGDGHRLTPEPGIHSAKLFGRARLLYHTASLADGSVRHEIMDTGGRVLSPVRSVAEAPPALPRTRWFRTEGEAGLDIAVTRPARAEAGARLPVLLHVYAGPHAKQVQASLRSYLQDQWYADRGYLVVRIDGRGTPWRGRAWERAIRGNLIDVALEDQLAGLTAVERLYPEADMTRVGCYGWSFGGYFTAMATLRRPDVFKAGVAGAPVVTWENYDTFYTERYLGLPQEHPGAYHVSNVTTYASLLERPLLLVHGLTDDNVYFQHTLQFANALFLAGKHYELLPMLGTHMAGVESATVDLRLNERILNFFDRNLR